MMLRIGTVAVALVALLSGLGCSQKADNTAGASNTSGPPSSKLRIVYIPKSTGNAYFDNVIAGFKEESAKIGADFSTTAPATSDATSQISFIKEQVQRGVDVIAITPNSPDALDATLDEAKAKGVLVITVDADLDKNESHRVAAVLPTDFSQVGVSQLDTLASQLPNGGDFAILSATHDAPNQNAWIDGMKKALAEPKYAKLKLVDIVYGDDDAAKSTTEAEGLFSKYPNLRGIISPTSVGLAATAQALDTAGSYVGGPNAPSGGGIVLTGLSTPNQMKKFVDKGVVAKFQLWSPHDMGVLACYLAGALKSGKIKPDPGIEVDVPGLGKHKFGPNAVMTAGPMVTFDKSNIGNYNF
ncbi:MAG: substrate-binding domain-containing protein [Fimbriimonadaceae bacterium]